ncbi:hypothetical protein A0257_07105 [Hymenobacter psoromatis]|nr:hypothetical protein A0257_07105 [Hymenobacter psoromatis]
MNPDYSLLTTKAECDAATADVTYELKTFSYRDTGLDLADDRATRSQASGAAALARKEADIVVAQGQATLPGLTALQQQDAADALELLQAQRKQLLKRNRTTTGTDRFLASVDAAQVQAQVDTLTAVLAAIVARRATLLV